MIDAAKIQELQDQINFEHDNQYKALLIRIEDLLNKKTDHDELVRLMAIPMVYSCWEGFFKTATTKCLIVIRDGNVQAKDATAHQRAAWLKKANFFKSYVDLLRNVMELDAEAQAEERHAKQKSKVKKGQHVLLAKTLEELDGWHISCLDKTIPPESLIMTFSNVNKDVVDINAQVIGLDQVSSYGSIDFNNLEALVGKRNSIGHGGISDGVMITYPGPKETKDLTQYAIRLIDEYRTCVIEWLEQAKGSAGGA